MADLSLVKSWRATLRMTLCGLTLAAGALTLTPAHAATPLANSQVQSVTSHDQRLADEITRRLRRMGLNLIKIQTARPTEMPGVPC